MAPSLSYRESAMAQNRSAIPSFFLYGEPPRPDQGRFVHVELLDERSRPANWRIRPHAHPNLHHVFLIESGGGLVMADGRERRFAASCLVAAPAGVVHGFSFEPETEGRVLTFSDALLRALASRDPVLMGLFSHGLWTAPIESDVIGASLARLMRELTWAAPGHALAVEAHLAAALVELLRSSEGRALDALAPPGPRAELVARFRALLEDTYRQHPAIEHCAAHLGVTPARLRAACQAIAGRSPLELAQDRLVLEAKRLMHYSNMSISQIAADLGFEDAAYFSRLFTRIEGVSPRAFRSAARMALDM